METGILEEYLEASRQKLEILLNRADGLPKSPRQQQADRQLPSQEEALLLESLEELSIALEELHVASEELRRQNEERLASLAALGAESKRYKELFDFAPDAYFVTDCKGKIEEANQAAATWLNVASSRLSSKPLSVFVALPHQRDFFTQVSLLRHGEEIRNWEVLMQPRKGEQFVAVVTVIPVKDATGKTVQLRWGMQISVRSPQPQESDNYGDKNITVHTCESLGKKEESCAVRPQKNGYSYSRGREDKEENNSQTEPERRENIFYSIAGERWGERCEKEKRERRDRLFRLMFEKAAVGMAFVDRSGCAIESNEALQEMLGYSRRELRQTSLTQLTFPLDRKIDRDLFGEIMAGKWNGYVVEKRFLTEAGCLKKATVTVSAVRDGNGDPIGAWVSVGAASTS
jgi:PAS domain S-box-containing protein